MLVVQAFVVSADGTSKHSTRSRFLVLATPASGWPSTLSAENGTSTALNPSSEEFSPRAPRHRQPPLRRPPRAARHSVFRSKQSAHKKRLTHCSGSLRSRPGHMKWSANKSPQHLAIHAEGSCDTRRRSCLFVLGGLVPQHGTTMVFSRGAFAAACSPHHHRPGRSARLVCVLYESILVTTGLRPLQQLIATFFIVLRSPL